MSAAVMPAERRRIAGGDENSVLALILGDLSELKSDLKATNATIAEMVTKMVRRDEVEALRAEMRAVVPRVEHESRWQSDERRFHKIEGDLSLVVEGRLGPRVETIENIMLPALSTRVTSIEANRLPPWALPVLAVAMPFAAIVVAHFWR